MNRHNHSHSQNTAPRGRPVSSLEEAHASNSFEHFLTASTLKTIFGTYRNICEYLHLKPNVIPLFYPKLKVHVNSWKAKPLWKKFDARANQKCYGRGKICPNTRVLIIGAGPCGLRTAIEAQLLGAKVVVVEKRDRLSRNNVLHLWPFVIDDLRALGAKKFFGKFCAGSIDHISIRQLQCILLKVALLLGVEIHTEVSFEDLIEPNPSEKTGWRAQFKPTDHPVSQYEFDVIIGADGKRNTLQGFKRKEFRGKLAIAITANFINKRTEAEARVEEISGVAFIFNQKFFKDLYAETGIDLENIVYYKDDTHYFVMTAKKQSLIDKGVIKQDLSDTERLLAPDNVDREELMNYAREAAEFSTNYQMPDLEFAVNHYGQPDVAMFDFTSMYAADNASRIIDRHGYKLMAILVGDSLLEPFWPTGSGCARGFLSSMDAAWAIKGWGSGSATPLEVVAERESIYRLLAQTTPENLNKDYKSYTLDPSTRYPNLNKNALLPHQVTSLYDTDNPKSIELKPRPVLTNVEQLSKKRRRRDSHVDPDTLLSWIKDQVREHEDLEVNDITTSFKDGRILCAILHHYRPDILDFTATNNQEPAAKNQHVFDLLEKELGIPPVMTGEELVSTEIPDFLTMLSYLSQVYDTFRCEIPHIKHPKLELPEIKRSDSTLKSHTSFACQNIVPVTLAQPARPSSRHKRHIDANILSKSNVAVISTQDRKPRKRKTLEKVGASVDRENRLPPSQAKRETDEDFAARIKDLEDKWREPAVVEKKPKDLLRAIGKIETSDWNIKEIEKKINENKLGKTVNKDKEKVPKWSREQFLARQNKMERQHLERQDSTGGKYAEIDRNIKQLEHKLKEGTTRDLNQHKVASITEKLVGKVSTEPPQSKPVQKSSSRVIIPPNHGSEYCHFCSKRVYLMERLSAEGKFFHRGCFRCQYCQTLLRLGSYAFDREGLYGNKFYCPQHFGMPGELRADNAELQNQTTDNLEINVISGVVGVDLLDRVQTPERVKFSNLSTGHISSDHEESPSPIDEDEWTDRNFRNSVVDTDSSEDDSSSTSDTDSEDDEAFEEALEEPPTKEGTMRWAERYKKRYSRKQDDDSESDEYSSSDHFSYYENSSGEDESDTATEGEEEIRARELRKQEVRVEPPVTDTGTDTEIASDETTSETSSDEIQNSATEISTDSEFAQDDPTPTHDKPPSKIFDDFVTKTRGTYSSTPKKVQVKSGVLQQPVNGRTTKNIELKFTPLVTTTPTPPPIVRKPAAPPTSLFGRTEGYALNRTQSTGGIAAKVSLELKKKYLLGETGSTGSIQKSGSASTLDLKFKSFHTNISDCQKLLKPAPEISASMQVFCTKLSERTSPLSPTFGSPLPSNIPKETIKAIVDTTPTSGGGGEIINESEGRPRSPVHERSIIVPTIDWDKNKQQNRQDKYVDSLSSSSSSSSSCDSHLEVEGEEKKKFFDNIPRLEVHDDLGEILQHDDGEMTLDSLNVIETTEVISINEPPKSITGEKKTLNQPKALPDLESDLVLPEVHSALHIKHSEVEEADNKSLRNSSGRSTPSINDDLITAALTETELSDWARDGNVSDDLEDELNPILKSDVKVEGMRTVEKGNKNLELEDLEHVCGRDKEIKQSKHPVVTECVNNILYPNIENIEFMDTGTETSSDDNFEVKNNGYVQFHDEDEFVEDSLSPNINRIIETTNPSVHAKNTGYCIIEGDQQDKNAVLKENENLKQQAKAASKQDNEDIVETGTTTEENTCSDSTVKNLTEKPMESIKEEKPETQRLIESSFKDRKRLEDKLAQVKQDMAKLNELKDDSNNIEFEEHCQRLQSKIEFSNVKDSIDIRKSRRKSKSEQPVKPDLIQEEKVSPQKSVVLTPSKLYSKEEIEKERNLNQQLVQEMVMMKMKAQNKSLERKKRNRNSFSPIRPFELNRSATTDLSVPPDVLLSTIPSVPLQKSQTTSLMSNSNMPLVGSEAINNLPDVSRTSDELFVTPKAPPRTKNDEAKRTAEKMKEDARARARLMSDEEFGLSPEDKLDRLRQVAGMKKGKEASDVHVHIQDSIESLVINTERRNSLLYNDTLKRNTSFRRSKSGETQSSFDLTVKSPVGVTKQPVRTKSVSELHRSLCLPSNTGSNEASRKNQFCKSDPNLLLDGSEGRKEKKKSKDRERRKSITKFLADIFSPKKKDTGGGGNKNFLSRISAKTKNKSKDKMAEEKSMRRNSVSEMNVRRDYRGNISPPPVPPLPENYSGTHLSKDESSDAENQGGGGHSSCDTLDQSGLHEGSLSSFSGRRSGRSARKAVRQAQLKRHRMAQEIQRKLEETEVKTRELERRGVMVEKALRGEVDDGNREEPELLKEWFDLMRDRTDLRRYERELTVRAQELELEDRHARLQHELRERLENEEPKTKEEMEVEGSIIKEMMDIVTKRDSLIAQIEEDRIRYAEEDRDFEEQMLAKGINLTPLVKSPADK